MYPIFWTWITWNWQIDASGLVRRWISNSAGVPQLLVSYTQFIVGNEFQKVAHACYLEWFLTIQRAQQELYQVVQYHMTFVALWNIYEKRNGTAKGWQVVRNPFHGVENLVPMMFHLAKLKNESLHLVCAVQPPSFLWESAAKNIKLGNCYPASHELRYGAKELRRNARGSGLNGSSERTLYKRRMRLVIVVVEVVSLKTKLEANFSSPPIVTCLSWVRSSGEMKSSGKSRKPRCPNVFATLFSDHFWAPVTSGIVTIASMRWALGAHDQCRGCSWDSMAVVSWWRFCEFSSSKEKVSIEMRVLNLEQHLSAGVASQRMRKENSH